MYFLYVKKKNLTIMDLNNTMSNLNILAFLRESQKSGIVFYSHKHISLLGNSFLYPPSSPTFLSLKREKTLLNSANGYA